MKTMQAVVTVCAAALLAACDSTPQADAIVGPQFAAGGGGSGPAASGHVERDLPTFGVTIEKYSFSAHWLGNGEVGGRFEARDVLADGSESVKEKGDVICFTVQPDGITARMGGVITNSSDGLEGRYAIWTVRDNGEGSNDPPDQATDLRWGFIDPAIAATHCAVGFPPEAFGTFGPSLRANVQVKP